MMRAAVSRHRNSILPLSSVAKKGVRLVVDFYERWLLCRCLR
jgi:hypothetical protein